MTNRNRQLAFEDMRSRGGLRFKTYLYRRKAQKRVSRWLAKFRRENGRQPNSFEILKWCRGDKRNI